MTPHPKTTISDGGLEKALRDLPAALNLAVFEQVSESLFEPVGQLPAWWPIAADFPIDLADQFPMLELFLSESGKGREPETSDIWTETGNDGEELYLEAVATGLGERRFLVLRSLPKARHTYQQLAHDFELAEAKAERATRAKSEFLNTMSHE